MTETKEGKIAHVIFNNPDNGYTVAVFETDDEQFTITGSFHAVNPGARYRLTGEFRVHRKYGEQFNVESYEELVPDDAEGIRNFLASGEIKGVGIKTAGLIVDAFGTETFDIIENDPEKLLQIKGIGRKTLDQIVESYSETREFAHISQALGEIGVELSQAVKIYKLYGAESMAVVRENPYTLVDNVYGMTFRRADRIASKIGIERDSGFRIQCGIKYALQYHAGSGSTFVPKDILVEESVKLLDVSSELIEENLVQLAFTGDIQTDSIDGMPVIYMYGYYVAEQSVAWNIGRIRDAKIPPLPADIGNLIADAEQREDISLSDEQREAVRTALTENICIITGGPGTGKTTIINIIVKILERLDIKTAVAAPTGRAAKRITETSGVPAKTIHRLLEYVFSEDEDVMTFGKNEDDPLEEKAVIVDEASMIDLMLMDGLLRALSDGTRLIIVGDADQLPSVGAGNVLRDMINSDYIPTIRLKEIFRQAGESLIVVNAHLINSGEYPGFNEKDSDFFMMEKKTDEDIVATIESLFTGRLESYYDFVRSWRDIQVITPTRKGKLGTASLNQVLQSVLNPASPDRAERQFGGKTFRVGDKVMQIRNNYSMEWRQPGGGFGTGVFNGDMGTIESIDTDTHQVVVCFDDRYVTYGVDEIDELELAYAITVHKSQGSEFPVVVMPMWGFPPMLMTRNLLYTAVTRGRRLVVIVGSQKRMEQMIDNNRSDERDTGLEWRLRQRDLGAF
jgi:exodeoxyribonuclease V alpha subunit